MLANRSLLVPSDGSRYREFQKRVSDANVVEEARTKLAAGNRSVPRALVLEGETHADCLIECKNAIIWVEGKRDDWLAAGTTWDVSRDQLARNLEAAWIHAQAAGKDFCVVVAYEDRLKHHEQALIEGYRTGCWSAGLAHLPKATRRAFAQRIGTVRWREIVARWPEMAVAEPALAELAPPVDL